jgi:hypothetical protein
MVKEQKKYINNYNFYIKQKNLDYLSPVEFLKSHYKVDKWKYLSQYNQAEVYTNFKRNIYV